MKTRTGVGIGLAAVAALALGAAKVHGALKAPDAAPAPTSVDRAFLAAAQSQALVRRQAQDRIRYTYFNAGTPNEKIVALTLDDGPDPEWTPRVLDVLKRENVPATFFLIGYKVKQHPEIVLREVAEGHDIGNHTYDHLQNKNIESEDWNYEIGHNNDLIQSIIGVRPRWFRAPGCHYTAQALKTMAALDMIRVDTTCNLGDTNKDWTPQRMQIMVGKLQPGAVILGHDCMAHTAEILPGLIEEIRRKGYQFVPLSELALRAQQDPKFMPNFDPPGEGIQIQR